MLMVHMEQGQSDKEISLGRADVYRLQAVYDSEDTSADATTPSMTISNISGTFTRGEKISWCNIVWQRVES